MLVKFIKNAIHKPTDGSKENNSISAAQDDGTDTELHESLPDDVNMREPSSEKDTKHHRSSRKSSPSKKLNSSTSKSTSEENNKSVKSISSENDKPAKAVSSEKIKTLERTRKKEKIHDKYRSTSRSSSSKDLRQDSSTSNWSDNIPVIKISGTESSECILEHQTEASSSQNGQKGKPRIIHQDHVETDTKSEEIPISELQIAEPQCPTSSSETLVTIKMEDEEPSSVIETKETDFLKCEDEEKKKSKFERLRKGIKEKSSIDTDQSVELQKSSNSDSTQTSSQTKTESSSGYKE